MAPGEISSSCYKGRADLFPALTLKLAVFNIFINNINNHKMCFQAGFLGNAKFVGLKNIEGNTQYRQHEHGCLLKQPQSHKGVSVQICTRLLEPNTKKPFLPRDGASPWIHSALC